MTKNQAVKIAWFSFFKRKLLLQTNPLTKIIGADKVLLMA